MDSYIRASELVLYPYVFLAGPNKHDTFLVFSLARKLQRSVRGAIEGRKQLNIFKRLHRDQNTGYILQGDTLVCPLTNPHPQYSESWGSTSFPPALAKPDSNTPGAPQLKHFILAAFYDPCAFQNGIAQSL